MKCHSITTIIAPIKAAIVLKNKRFSLFIKDILWAKQSESLLFNIKLLYSHVTKQFHNIISLVDLKRKIYDGKKRQE
jgi:hypothetical protein